MSKISKKRKEIITNIDFQKTYKLDEAIDIIKKISKAKFEETLDIAINLSLNDNVQISERQTRTAGRSFVKISPRCETGLCVASNSVTTIIGTRNNQMTTETLQQFKED